MRLEMLDNFGIEFAQSVNKKIKRFLKNIVILG